MAWWLLFSCIRLQPFYQQKTFRDFLGVNRNSDVYTLTLCSTIRFLEWGNSLGNLPLIHKFQFHTNNLTLTSPTSFMYKIVPMKCATTLTPVKKFWIQLKVMTTLTFLPEFQEQPGVNTGSRTTVPLVLPFGLYCQLYILYVAQWVG